VRDDDWHYRLVLVPRSSPTHDRDTVAQQGWQLVSTKVSEDGLTEQRIYRRPKLRA
jgi:hypothetical protein